VIRPEISGALPEAAEIVRFDLDSEIVSVYVPLNTEIVSPAEAAVIASAIVS
jgi:hypothetical protein